MGSSDDLLYNIALTFVEGIGDKVGKNLLQKFGDAKSIFELSSKDLIYHGVPVNLSHSIKKTTILQDAQRELEFIEKNNIKVLLLGRDDYPQNLKDCSDAPLLLYYRGNTNINTHRIISIVGTRKATSYGLDFTESFINDISSLYPNSLIVSGLAYGIDVCAHKASLSSGLPTLGVMATGLNTVYPFVHRKIAYEMLKHGGLLTEFPFLTKPDKFNFIRRNRVVAGIADAVIVVESADKGGALITAEIAGSYCKDVFAVPGRSIDKYSRGCNNLILDHKADIVCSAKSFLDQMNWTVDAKPFIKSNEQLNLFTDMDVDQTQIIKTLNTNFTLHIDEIARRVELLPLDLGQLLLQLELNGIIESLPGNFYRLR